MFDKKKNDFVIGYINIKNSCLYRRMAFLLK